VLISAAPAFRSSELQKSAALMEAVLKAARSVESRFSDGSVRIAITGAHRSALDNATMIREDSTRTSVIAAIAVLALMLAAYRRRWLALLGLLPTAFGALGAMVVSYLTGDPVSAVALGCGSILIGVTVDYGICVLYRVDDFPPEDREQLARAVAQLVPALTFGALTTMAAFFVMFVSPVSGHRQLSLFGAVGIALAAVFALVILPLFIPISPAGTGRVLPLTTIMQRLFDWRARHARLVLPLLLLFTGFCVAGVWRLRFEGDFARLNGVTAETRRDEDAVREVWGKALSLTSVVVGGANREEALQKNERVCAVLQTLREKQAVETFSSIAPLLPSEQMRAAHLRDWRAFWTESRLRGLSNSLANAAANLGFRVGAFQPFLERVAAPHLSSAAVAGTNSALNRFAAEYLSEKDGKPFITTLVKTKDRESYQRMREAVRKEVPGAMLLNKTALADEIIRIARRALPVFSVMVAGLNALLLYLLLGRLVLVLITLLPMAAGVFWTLGSLGLLGLPVDMSNFIFVIFVVGVGGDYSLFMVLAELEPLRGYRERTASTGGAVTICALTTLFGVGVLVLARHPALFSVGLTALLGISFSLLATLFLVPPCMKLIARRCAARAAFANPAGFSASRKRGEVSRLYRYHGPYVTQFVFWKMKTDALFAAVEAAAPRHGQILDLGCGFGILGHWLTLFAPERSVRGVDFDEDKIRVAQATSRANPQVIFERHDILEWLEYPACDCVLLCDVLHYFPREMKAEVLRKVFQALRPGGSLVVRDACAAQTSGHGRVAWAEKWAVRLGQNRSRHGLHFETEATHLALLREAGFCQLELRKNAGLGSNALVIATKPVH
jgi:predicted exporter/SAM-dependent methyltransferase